jgi:hypothetical protein
MLRFGTRGIKRTRWEDPNDPNSRPVLEGTVNWADYAFYASYGRPILPRLNLGASAIVLEGAHGFTGWGSFGQALDVAALAGPFGPFTVGVNVQDVVGRIKWDTGTVETIPMNVKAGAAFRQPFPAWDSRLLLALDADVKFANYGDAAQVNAGTASFDFAGGGEWWYKNTVALRLGTERSAFTGGVGVAVRAAGATFGIDYAYLSDTGLDASHRASVAVAF